MLNKVQFVNAKVLEKSDWQVSGNDLSIWIVSSIQQKQKQL